MAAAPGPPAETSLRKSRIVHAALVASLLTYPVVAHVMRAAGASPPPLGEPTLGMIRLALYVVAGSLALAVLVLRSRWLTAETAAATFPVLQTRLITCLALAEAIGICGLVLLKRRGSASTAVARITATRPATMATPVGRRPERRRGP